MGAKGIRLEDPANVEDALAEALAHRGGPVVVDAVVDSYALSVPAHIPLHTIEGFTMSTWKQVLSGHPGTIWEEIKHNLGLATTPGLLP